MKSQTIELSIACESDVPALGTLLALLFAQEAEFAPNSEAQERGLLKIIENPQIGFILIAKIDGLAVGMVNVLLTVSTALGERVAIFEDMIVAPALRNSGTGSQLIAHAIKEARKQHCKRITVLSDNSNQAAHKFYTKHGFMQSNMIPLRLHLD